MSRKEVAKRLAARFEGRSLQNYAYWKVRMDPVYAEVVEVLRGHDAPLVDLGCGVGLLPFFLREHGYTAPITGIDFDERKIAVARSVASQYTGISFVSADARDPLPPQHDVIILDTLHYIDAEARQAILENVARSADFVVLRQGIADDSWRHRFTMIVDAIGRAIRWMKAEGLRYPTIEQITAPFARDFEVEAKPAWGRTPYNNYLFVFRRR